MKLIKNYNKWYKKVDPFELIAIIFIIIGIVAIILVFLTSSFNEFFDSTKHDITHYAELIGGFVGSLWALAGVLLFYASLASQKSELEDQKHLLVKQIDEVVKQTQEFSKQSDIQAKQQYENTYFQLLRFHNEIITSIVLEITGVDFISGTNTIRQIYGRKSFVEYYDIYKRFFNTQLEILMTEELTIPIIQRIVDNSYKQFFDEYQADLGHYFRNLFNILYFIDNLKDKEKSKFYLELLHAQLSNYELVLLYFHCASSNNSEFKILLEKYELLATIPDDEIISMSKRLYNPKAFGKEDFDNDDDMNFGGGDSSNLDFNIEQNSINLNDTDLFFSENDILSKFASLSKKQKNHSNNDFANVDFENNIYEEFNLNLEVKNDPKDLVDKKSSESNNKINKNVFNFLDKQIENTQQINKNQLDKINESHSNDNLLDNLASKLKNQMANKSQDVEDNIWTFEDYMANENSINENSINENSINENFKNNEEINNDLYIKSDDELKSKLKKIQLKSNEDFNELNELKKFDFENEYVIEVDHFKDGFSDKINLLDKLKKISEIDNNIDNNIDKFNHQDISDEELEYNYGIIDNTDIDIDIDIDLNEDDNIDSIKAKLDKKKSQVNFTNRNSEFNNKISNDTSDISGINEGNNSTFEPNNLQLESKQILNENHSYDNLITISNPKYKEKSIDLAENKKMYNLAKLIQKRK